MIRWILRFSLAALFLAAAAAKLYDVRAFATLLQQYRILHSSMIMPVAYVIIGIEVLLGIWLFSGRRLHEAAWMAMVLQIFYLLWGALALVRGLTLNNSGNFGAVWPQPLTWWLVLGNLLMIVLCWMFYRIARKKGS